GSPVLLFIASFVFNVALGLICFLLFGGRELLRKRDLGRGLESKDGTPADEVAGSAADEPTGPGASGGGDGRTGGAPAPYHDPERRAARRSVQTTMVKDHDDDVNVTTLDMNRIVTLIGLVVLAVMVVPPRNQDVGSTSSSIAVVISV